MKFIFGKKNVNHSVYLLQYWLFGSESSDKKAKTRSGIEILPRNLYTSNNTRFLTGHIYDGKANR